MEFATQCIAILSGRTGFRLSQQMDSAGKVQRQNLILFKSSGQ